MSQESMLDARAPADLSLDQLIALNDEIAALVRAGIPLERGLMQIGTDLPGRLGQVSRLLAESMTRGQTLQEALAAAGNRIPPLYRAVVEAGIRSGRLPAALESLAGYARNYAAMRQALGLALMYPLIVLTMAYILFLGFATQVVPRFLTAYASLQLPVQAALVALAWLGDRAIYWGPVFPVVLAVVVFAWYVSGRSGAFPSGRSGFVLSWIPWMRGMLAHSCAASFADMLALLVAHDVPFPEAIELAAASSGDLAMIRASKAIAGGVRRGETLQGTWRARRDKWVPSGELSGLAGATRAGEAFPSMLWWMMVTGHRQGLLVPALRHAATTYRRLALNQADLVRTFLPTFLLLLIGATATIFFAVTIFLPFSKLLNQLSLE